RPTPNPDGIGRSLLADLISTMFRGGHAEARRDSMGGLTARNLKIAVASVLMLLFMAGCGTTGGSNSTANSDTPQAPVSATLSASPVNLTFGSVAMGSSSAQSVTLSN